MRRVIPFAPWQTAYFLRWLRDMSRRGWELQTIKGVKAVFVPAASGGQDYALFPQGAAPQELDELFRRLEEGSLTAPPALDRPMPGSLTLPEDPRFAKLVGEIGPYKYVQLLCQLRRDNGWEEVCDWGGLCVMRSTRPDAVPPPRLPELAENAKLHRKGQTSTAAMNLGFLLSLPFLAVLKNTGLLFWQKLAAGAVLVAATCFAVDRLLFRGILSPEKWDDMSYEECLHRPVNAAADMSAHRKRPPFGGLFCGCLCVLRPVLAEQQGDEPQSGNAHQRIDDAADGAGLPAEQECHAVKAEKPHAAPVQRTDDDEYQRDAVYDLHESPSLCQDCFLP